MTSRAWYVVAAALFLAGGAGAGWALWTGLSGIGASLVRVTVPGSTELTLEAPGAYTIFHEQDSVIGGHFTSVPSLAGLTVTVTDEASGAKLPVKSPSMNMTYSIGGHDGVAVLAFDAAHPGRYRLAAIYDDGRTEPKTVLAVDLGFLTRLLRTIALAFGAAGAGTLAALVIALLTFFRRRKVLRASSPARFS
jgi:hypothetical protein